MKKKKNTHQTTGLSELRTKQEAFVKDLVSSRLSMDVSGLSSATNMQNLLRELKAVRRLAAIEKKKAKTQEVTQ